MTVERRTAKPGRPGRPKGYERAELIAGALELFWADGYEATGMRKLSEELGVSPSALYDEFGDKEGLFQAALDHYSETVVGVAFGRNVESAEPSLESISRYFEWLIETAPSGSGTRCNGCLMTNTISELDQLGSRTGELVAAHLERQRRGFERALRGARKRGELAPSIDPATAARSTVTFTQGFLMMLRALPDRVAIAATADAYIDQMRPGGTPA